jgi:signal transduction histidine kinase
VAISPKPETAVRDHKGKLEQNPNRLEVFALKNLVSVREWLLTGLVFVMLSFALIWLLVQLDVFDWWYQYTQAHEEWGLDDVSASLFAVLLAFSITAAMILGYLIFRITRSARDQMALEREMMQARKLQSMGILVGGVAHSIANHLQPIPTLCRLAIANLPPDSDAVEDLQKAILATNSATELLRKILRFSALPVSAQDGAPIGVAVQKAIDLAAVSLPSTVTLLADIEPIEEAAPMADTELEVIVLNLVQNAADALRGGAGQVVVSLKAYEPDSAAAGSVVTADGAAWVCIEVSDNGLGIEAGAIERVFDPLYTTKPVGRGTGFGLSETHGIISRVGGVIDLQSEVNVGTVVRVYLPVIQTGPEHDAGTARQES